MNTDGVKIYAIYFDTLEWCRIGALGPLHGVRYI
jgi:hypothetical protein